MWQTTQEANCSWFRQKLASSCFFRLFKQGPNSSHLILPLPAFSVDSLIDCGFGNGRGYEPAPHDVSSGSVTPQSVSPIPLQRLAQEVDNGSQQRTSSRRQSVMAKAKQQTYDDREYCCASCDDGGPLYLCDFCPRVFHKECHIYAIPSGPGIWKCLLCENLAAVRPGNKTNYFLFQSGHVSYIFCRSNWSEAQNGPDHV